MHFFFYFISIKFIKISKPLPLLRRANDKDGQSFGECDPLVEANYTLNMSLKLRPWGRWLYVVERTGTRASVTI
jgi:hypothetical protein